MAREKPDDRNSPYVQPGKARQEAWLKGYLGDERPLAWLPIHRVVEPARADRRDTWRYLLTTDRSGLVCWHKDEPPQVYKLPDEALVVTSSVTSRVFQAGPWVWKSRHHTAQLFTEIALLPGLHPIQRCRETARLAWLSTGSSGPTIVDELVDRLREDPGEPVDRLTAVYVRTVTGTGAEGKSSGRLPDSDRQELVACLQAFVGDSEDRSPELVRWAQAWSVDPLFVALIVEIALAELSPEGIRRLVSLHQVFRRAASVPAGDAAATMVADVLYGEHLLLGGQRQAALAVLEAQKERLSDDGLLHLMPLEDLDLTATGAQGLRIRLLNLLVQARGNPQKPDVDTLAELARLQPLLPGPVADLVRAAEGSLRRRAEALHELLDAPRFEPLSSGGGHRSDAFPLAPLQPHMVEEKLRHPATRSGGVLRRFQAWLGRAAGPDRSFLRDYAERATTEGHGAFTSILADATLVLGVPAVEAYVSRGDRAVGVRAFDGDPPFIVIGARHLDPESPLYWPKGVLQFLVAAELGHLRFHHTRLTSHDMWDGAFDKGTKVLETLGSLAGPLGLLGNAFSGLRKLAFAHAILRKAEHLSLGFSRAAEAMGYARRWQRGGDDKTKAGPGEEGDLAEGDDALLAACRVMQLTADRAGLLLCDDLAAAVTALFVSSPAARAELPLAQAHGLVTTLSRRDEGGELHNQGLAIRLAEVASFYLSREYEDLRQTIHRK